MNLVLDDAEEIHLKKGTTKYGMRLSMEACTVAPVILSAVA